MCVSLGERTIAFLNPELKDGFYVHSNIFIV